MTLIIWVVWKLIKGFGYRKNKNDNPKPFGIIKTNNSGNRHNNKSTYMGIFDKFKKKQEPHYDPTDIKIKDLRVGFIFDYDLKSWQIKEEYEYDWGDNYFTREYKIEAANEVAYLHIDYSDEGSMTVSKKLKVRALGEDIPEKIVKKKRPPKKIVYKETTYYLDKESPGYFSDEPDNDDSWVEFISWDYYDADEKLVACVEQWGEREFEASYGVVVNEYEITNILPGTV